MALSAEIVEITLALRDLPEDKVRQVRELVRSLVGTAVPKARRTTATNGLGKTSSPSAGPRCFISIPCTRRTKGMKTFRPGDVVVVRFPGVQQSKNRPAVVGSTDLYQAARGDVVLALLDGASCEGQCPDGLPAPGLARGGLAVSECVPRFPVHVPGLPTRLWAM